MKSKRLGLKEAVSRISSGASIAIGGSLLRRQPVAIVHEIIRQEIRNLQLVTWATTIATDLLCAADAVRIWEGIYAGFFRHGMAPNFRRGVEQGRIQTRDFSESALVARFRAAGMGLSFLPGKGLLGTDMARRNPEQVKPITCPFTGERYLALEAVKTDFTILHGYVADEFGNVQWPVVRDSDDIDQMMAAASKRLIVTVERIVPHAEICRRPALTYIPHTLVEAVVEVPYGAYPTATDEDDAALIDYLERVKTPEGARAYLDEFVRASPDHAGYLARHGGTAALRHLDVELA
jgi:glutaconate CoA-transferase subunit A